MKTLATRATPASKMLEILAANVGSFVTVRNRDEVEMTDGPRVRYALHGKLEAPDLAPEDKHLLGCGGEWYLRAGESYHGPIGIHFPQSRIMELTESSVGHLEVVLL